MPSIVSLVMAALLAPALLGVLRRAGWLGRNHRGRSVPFPTGILIGGAALVALGSLAALGGGDSGLGGLTARDLAFVLGVAALGLLDDRWGGAPGAPRGLRGHARHLLDGGLSTGALKAFGTVALAGFALSGRGLDLSEHLLGTAVLSLSAHVFNLLDTRPGRSIKGLVILGAALTLGTRDLAPLAALGPLVAPVLVLLPIDLRERGMLGDTGAATVGAVAGLWVVIALPPVGQAVAAAALALTAAYGELRSITGLVERTPLLRGLDSFGRHRA